MASRQYEIPPFVPGNRVRETEDSPSSSEGVDSHTFTREPSPHRHPIEDEFSDLKNLLKACKRKLRNLERRRFEIHGAEAMEIGPQGTHFRINSSYNRFESSTGGNGRVDQKGGKLRNRPNRLEAEIKT